MEIPDCESKLASISKSPVHKAFPSLKIVLFGLGTLATFPVESTTPRVIGKFEF